MHCTLDVTVCYFCLALLLAKSSERLILAASYFESIVLDLKKERRQKEDGRGPGSNIQPSDNGHDALPLIHGGLICRRVKSEE